MLTSVNFEALKMESGICGGIPLQGVASIHPLRPRSPAGVGSLGILRAVSCLPFASIFPAILSLICYLHHLEYPPSNCILNMNLAHCGFEPLTSLTEPCHGLDHVDARKYAQLWFKLWPQESSVNSSGTVSSQPAQDPAALLRHLCRPLHGDDILETDSDHGSVPPTHIDLNEHSELAIGSIGEAAVDQGLAAFALRQEYFRLADVVSMHMQNQIKASQTDGSGVARLLLIGHPGIGTCPDRAFRPHVLTLCVFSQASPSQSTFCSSFLCLQVSQCSLSSIRPTPCTFHKRAPLSVQAS